MAFLAVLLAGCDREDEDVKPELEFVPTEVFVKFEGGYTIDKVFEFINSLGHEVPYIRSLKYTSDLPPDSLEYVLNYLNAKPYTQRDVWRVTGYRHYKTDEISIFPTLFDMKNAKYQNDWLESIQVLQLREDTEGTTAGFIVFFRVPEGEEKTWESKFEEYDFVEWAELNYIVELNPWP